MGYIWFDVCWCYFVVWLWWCGIRMQAEARLSLLKYRDDARSNKHKIENLLNKLYTSALSRTSSFSHTFYSTKLLKDSQPT